MTVFDMPQITAPLQATSCVRQDNNIGALIGEIQNLKATNVPDLEVLSDRIMGPFISNLPTGTTAQFDEIMKGSCLFLPQGDFNQTTTAEVEPQLLSASVEWSIERNPSDSTDLVKTEQHSRPLLSHVANIRSTRPTRPCAPISTPRPQPQPQP